jgi:hypothetical protein
MAVVLANDHDLKNGKKSNDFSELWKQQHLCCHEYVLGKLKVRLSGGHCQKMKICKDKTDDDDDDDEKATS